MLYPPVTAASKAFSPTTVLAVTEFAPLPTVRLFTVKFDPSKIRFASPFRPPDPSPVTTLLLASLAKARCVLVSVGVAHTAGDPEPWLFKN